MNLDRGRRVQPERSTLAYSNRRDAWCLDCAAWTAWIEDAYAINGHGCTWLGIVTACRQCGSDHTQEDA